MLAVDEPEAEDEGEDDSLLLLEELREAVDEPPAEVVEDGVDEPDMEPEADADAALVGDGLELDVEEPLGDADDVPLDEVET